MTISNEAGLKYDSGKVRWGLLPYDALEQVAEILTFGATKYDARNWKNGIHYERLYSATQRHLKEGFQERKEKDEESGKSPLAHAICDLLFLLSYEVRGMNEWDDRPIIN